MKLKKQKLWTLFLLAPISTLSIPLVAAACGESTKNKKISYQDIEDIFNKINEMKDDKSYSYKSKYLIHRISKLTPLDKKQIETFIYGLSHLSFTQDEIQPIFSSIKSMIENMEDHNNYINYIKNQHDKNDYDDKRNEYIGGQYDNDYRRYEDKYNQDKHQIQKPIPFYLSIEHSKSKKTQGLFNYPILNFNFNGTDRQTYLSSIVKVEFYQKTKKIKETIVSLDSNAFTTGIEIADLNLEPYTQYDYHVLSTDQTPTTLFKGKYNTGNFKIEPLVEASISLVDFNFIKIDIDYKKPIQNSNGKIRISYVESESSNNSSSTDPTPTAIVKELDQQIETPEYYNYAKQYITLENLESGKNYHIKVEYVSDFESKETITLLDLHKRTKKPRFEFKYAPYENIDSEYGRRKKGEQEYLLHIKDVEKFLSNSKNKLILFHKKQNDKRWLNETLTYYSYYSKLQNYKFDIQKEIISKNSTDPFIFYDFKLELEKEDGTKEEIIPLTQTILLNPAYFNTISVSLDNPKLVDLNNRVLRNVDHDTPVKHNTFAVMFDQLKTRKELDFFVNFIRTTNIFPKITIAELIWAMAFAIVEYINNAYNSETWDLDKNSVGQGENANKGYWNSKHIWFQHPLSDQYPLSYILLATNETEGFLSNLEEESKEYILGGLKAPSISTVGFLGLAVDFNDFWRANSDPLVTHSDGTTSGVNKGGQLAFISQIVKASDPTTAKTTMMQDKNIWIEIAEALKFAFGSKQFDANHDFKLPEPEMVEKN